MEQQKNPHKTTITFRDELPEKTFASLPKRTYKGQTYDIILHAWMGKYTGWLSPASVGLAVYDWMVHLINSPAKQYDLAEDAWKSLAHAALNAYACYGITKYGIKCIETRPGDSRFKNNEWETLPFKLIVQNFLLYERWWDEASISIRGVSKHHEDVVNFMTRQILDMVSPSNFPLTNPEVLKATLNEFGTNFINGMNNYIEDHYRILLELPPAGSEKFQVGVNLAITPGKVIYQNHLIELIQYEPQTAAVYAEPVLIIPAWIMKYYILDLSPHNSLVKYLVKKGHTVFMISWRNPDSEDRDLGLEDYLNLGIMDALNVIGHVVPDKKINATGYCLGGTLLMIAAAAMAHKGDDRLKSITLFAAEVDFRDSGELSLFIDPSQVTYLEDIMWEKGYLDGAQMAWAFSMLRSNDLIWSKMIHDYLLGKRRPINDLIAWDNDTTRLPYRMHSEYLRQLFLNNELVEGRFKVEKKKIALADIKVPIFAVGTTKDHVSPWRSVYKVQLFTNAEVTFVLTNGGHNAGIVSEPGHKNRNYRILTRKKGDKHISPDVWLELATKEEGSWWPAWEKWLADFSGEKVALPPMGNPKKDYNIICDAPGTYVLKK